MTSSLRDVAIDLINDTKTAIETSKKMFYLEQIKEILLHRDTSIIEEILPDVLEFWVIKNGNIRKLLIGLAGEAIRINKSMIPVTLSMFGFLASENNDTILRLIAQELCKSHSKIVIYIASMPPKTKTVQLDPKLVWGELKNLKDKLIEIVSSDCLEAARIQILLLIEEIISFGLPLPPQSADPRLARSQAANRDKVETATDIPLEHAFINRNELEQQAEDLFGKYLLWASKGGPAGHPFTPALMGQLGSSIAVVATSRPKKAAEAATALIFLLQGKGNVCHLMSSATRDALARATQRFSFAASLRDADGRMAKLKEALTKFTAITGNETNESVLGKRGLGDEDDGAEDLVASAIAALDAVENEIKTKAARIAEGDQVASTNADQSATGTQQGVNVTKSVLGKEGNTELASDLAEFPEIPQNLKLAQLPVASSSSSSSSSINSDVLKLITPSTDVFKELAISSLQRILESYVDVKTFGKKAKQAHILLTVRTVVNMAVLDIKKGEEGENVSVIRSLCPSVKFHKTEKNTFAEGVPLDVKLPRSIWLFLSFMLTYQKDDFSTTLARLRAAQRVGNQGINDAEKSDFLLYFLQELQGRIGDDEIDEEDDLAIDISNSIRDLYDNVCLVILSRTLQNVNLRSMAKKLFKDLFVVPTVSLNMLKLLMCTGTHAADTAISRKESKNRGTRTEARELLSQSIISGDEITSMTALNLLLSSTVSDEFEIRERAVKELTEKVIPATEWVDEIAACYAVQSVILALGLDVVQKSINTHHDNKKDNDNDDNKMSIESNDNEEKNDDEIKVNEVNLESALKSLEKRQAFEGPFQLASSTLDNQEPYIRTCFHFFLQYCVLNPSLLKVMTDIYRIAASKIEINSNTNNEKTDSTAMEIIETNTAATTTTTNKSKWEVIKSLLESSLRDILPAVIKRHKMDSQTVEKDVISAIMNHDILSRPLLDQALVVLHRDETLPAAPTMIAKVKEYLTEIVDTSKPEDMRIIDDIRTLIPLLGGMQSQEILNLLPTIMKSFINDLDTLKLAFCRIVQSRPPALSRKELLSYLHRIDESTGLEAKQRIACIDLCLNHKEVFTGDVLKETLIDLLSDAVPAQVLMRTAIRAAQIYSEIKKFVLSTVVPNLIKKRVWLIAPKVWEGIAPCVKMLIKDDAKDLRDSEATLRCLLGLPGPQLKLVLKQADKVKGPMAKVLKLLSVIEKDDVLSGRWAGIQEEGNKADPEKLKIIKELAGLAV